jgi:HEAT repeat protein
LIAPALQDGWKDTHRIYLRNGNALDGRIEKNSDKEILLRWTPGVLLWIKTMDVVKIEEITIRTINSEPRKPRVGPAVPSVGDGPGTDEAITPKDPTKPKSEIEKLFERLMSNPDTTYEVLVKEVKGLGPEGGRAMIRELPYMNAEKTNLALVALDQMRDLPIEPEIRGLLEAKRPSLRAAACNLLANRGATSSMNSIRSLLRDPAPQVRTAALMALPMFGDAAVLDGIADLAIDSDAGVRARAIRSAEELSFRTSTDNDLAQRWLSLAGRGTAASQAEIAASLGRLADRANEAFPSDEVRERLAGMLTARETDARAAAAFSLSGVKPAEKSADALLTYLESEREPKVVVSMCEGFGRLRIHKTLAPLVERIRDDSKDVRAAAQRALEKISGQVEFGSDYEKWKEWLDKSKGQNP